MHATLPEFSQYLSANKLACRDVVADDIRAFFRAVAARGLAVHRARRASSRPSASFTGFCMPRGVRADNPAAAIDSPKQQRPLPKIMSVEDVDKLLETVRDWAVHAQGAEQLRALRGPLLVGDSLRHRIAGLRIGGALPRDVLSAQKQLIVVQGKGRARAHGSANRCRRGAALEAYGAVLAGGRWRVVPLVVPLARQTGPSDAPAVRSRT